MVEANGAYKHNRYEQIQWKSLSIMSNVEVFAAHFGWMAGWLDCGWVASLLAGGVNIISCIDKKLSQQLVAFASYS